MLGVCLGAQLLAAAAGARSIAPARPRSAGARYGCARRPGPTASSARCRTASPRTSGIPTRSRSPSGAVELARNDVCPQAYRLGDAAWGVQFHPEVTEPILADWFATYDVDPDAVALGFDPQGAAHELPMHLPQWMDLGATLFDAFLAAAAARAPRAA